MRERLSKVEIISRSQSRFFAPDPPLGSAAHRERTARGIEKKREREIILFSDSLLFSSAFRPNGAWQAAGSAKENESFVLQYTANIVCAPPHYIIPAVEEMSAVKSICRDWCSIDQVLADRQPNELKSALTCALRFSDRNNRLDSSSVTNCISFFTLPNSFLHKQHSINC